MGKICYLGLWIGLVGGLVEMVSSAVLRLFEQVEVRIIGLGLFIACALIMRSMLRLYLPFNMLNNYKLIIYLNLYKYLRPFIIIQS